MAKGRKAETRRTLPNQQRYKELRPDAHQPMGRPQKARAAKPVQETPRKAMPTMKGEKSLTNQSLAADAKFNRGAPKPWVPKGGRAKQTDLKVPDPHQPQVATGPGYDGSKGYKTAWTKRND